MPSCVRRICTQRKRAESSGAEDPVGAPPHGLPRPVAGPPASAYVVHAGQAVRDGVGPHHLPCRRAPAGSPRRRARLRRCPPRARAAPALRRPVRARHHHRIAARPRRVRAGAVADRRRPRILSSSSSCLPIRICWLLLIGKKIEASIRSVGKQKACRN